MWGDVSRLAIVSRRSWGVSLIATPTFVVCSLTGLSLLDRLTSALASAVCLTFEQRRFFLSAVIAPQSERLMVGGHCRLDPCLSAASARPAKSQLVRFSGTALKIGRPCRGVLGHLKLAAGKK